MILRTARLGFACLVGAAAAPSAVAQPPAAAAPAPRTPLQRFQAARDLLFDGRLELAADELRLLNEANPTDADLIGIQNRFGPTAFERLRDVRAWADDPATNATAIKTVNDLVTKSREANRKFFTDPARLARFVRNLGAGLEERTYAEQQLRLAGPSVVPAMVGELAATDDPTLRAGILGAISRLGPETISGFLGALPGLNDGLKANLLAAVAARPDAGNLSNSADTDPLPWLWYYSAIPQGDGEFLRTEARRLLAEAVGPINRRRADLELVALGRPLTERNIARFAAFDAPANTVAVTTWDAAAKALVTQAVPRHRAEEYFGLRNLRWALERNPQNAEARSLFLSLAADRAAERAGSAPLSRSAPDVYALLAASASPDLLRQLDRALAAQRAGESLAILEVLADRADRTLAVPPPGDNPAKASPLVKGLTFPDPRVQFRAAVALARIPGAPLHGQQARVVEILTRALAGVPEPAAAPGTALIVDPSGQRRDRVAAFLAQLGYRAERFTSGRELARRVRKSSDFDLLVVDRHVFDPMLEDLLPQLRADANSAGRPVLLVASADSVKPVPLETQLLRLAVMVAVSEGDLPLVDAPYFNDPRKPPAADPEAAAREVALRRDEQLAKIIAARAARLRRLVVAADFPPSASLDERLALRVPQLTYAVLAAEFPVSATASPATLAELQSLTRRIQNRPELTAATEGVPTLALSRLIEQLDEVLTPAQKERMEIVRRRIDPVSLSIPPDVERDLALEDRLQRAAEKFRAVRVIPEPFGLVGLSEDVKAVTADPAGAPRDPASKREEARIAVELLRRMGTGDIPGYDLRPAESALRNALRDDALAPAAADALARVPTAEVQQDYLRLAMDAARPLPLRLSAADRALAHAQQYGRLTPTQLEQPLQEVVQKEAPGELRGKLVTLGQVLFGKADGAVAPLLRYDPPLAPPAAPVAPPAAPKPAEPPPAM